jgi:toxin ParE1/3/4
MTRLVVTTDADSDFHDIAAYLQREAGERIAADYGRRFDLALQRVCRFPRSGSPRPRLGAATRVVPVPPYLMVYDYNMENDTVVLLRILHERRNITQPLLRRS